MTVVWYKNVDRSFFRFVTMHAFDRQTDGQTDRNLIARPRLHSAARWKAEFQRTRMSIIIWVIGDNNHVTVVVTGIRVQRVEKHVKSCVHKVIAAWKQKHCFMVKRSMPSTKTAKALLTMLLTSSCSEMLRTKKWWGSAINGIQNVRTKLRRWSS